jgi:hypothetical protein
VDYHCQAICDRHGAPRVVHVAHDVLRLACGIRVARYADSDMASPPRTPAVSLAARAGGEAPMRTAKTRFERPCFFEQREQDGEALSTATDDNAHLRRCNACGIPLAAGSGSGPCSGSESGCGSGSGSGPGFGSSYGGRIRVQLRRPDPETGPQRRNDADHR